MKWKTGNCRGITWHGTYYSREQILVRRVSDFPESEALLIRFLKEWWADSPVIFVPTSGSTGIPKIIPVEKERMISSAEMTCFFLQLKRGNRALLCMPLEFIAGKMMVVRALVWGLDLFLVPPSSHPLSGADLPPIHLAALVPLQVYHSLENKTENRRIRSIRHLLIGGGAIDPALEDRLFDFPHPVWSTYGMTETLSHIALRRVNGKGASVYYKPFPGISLSLSAEGTLVIEAPLLSPEVMVTNDRAELMPEGSFRILGRRDNVICSGGIKLQFEEVETALRPFLNVPFAVSWVADERLGQCAVLLMEVPEKGTVLEDLRSVFQQLPSFQRPRKVCITQSLPRTETGKPARAQIHLLCESLVKNGFSQR